MHLNRCLVHFGWKSTNMAYKIEGKKHVPSCTRQNQEPATNLEETTVPEAGRAARVRAGDWGVNTEIGLEIKFNWD